VGTPAVPWPARAPGAPGGSAFADRIARVVGPNRERAILDEIVAGNVPDFLRTWVEVPLPSATCHAAGEPDAIWVLCDYLSIGADDDFFLIPMLPSTAQTIADRFDCLLPTSRIVDLVYEAAPIKLPAISLEAGPLMIRTEGYRIHHQRVQSARQKAAGSLGALTAGHKKDIVITPRLSPGRLAIYGFYKPDGEPVQQLNLSHSTKYVDYAHGVRLVRGVMRLGGSLRRVADVLGDASTSALLSEEGPISSPRYP
jgi:hypothetical protein